MPPIPQSHGASTVTEEQVSGNDTFSRSSNAVDNTWKLDLLSGTNSIAWGIWQLNSPLKYFDSIEVQVEATPGEEVWLALADFSLGAWDFAGPFTEDHTFLINEALHRDADGNLYVAAIAHDGDQPTVSRLVAAIEDTWVTVTVDMDGNVGAFPSLALINGRPAISYYDSTNGDLKYALSSTATGSAPGDWSVTTVDTGYTSDVGQYTSLAEVHGQPAISYYDADGEALRYARRNLAIPPNPATWTRIEVDTNDFGTAVGMYSSLAVVNDRPLISYYDDTYNDLRHAVSTTASGTSADDWTTYITESSGEVGENCSLAMVDGVAAVSYFDDSGCRLMYRWFSNPSEVAIDSGLFSVSGISLAIRSNGQPAVGYYSGGLQYAYCTTDHGTAEGDWTTLEIDSGLTSRAANLAVIDGRPALCYWSTDEGAQEKATVVFAWSTTASGANLEDWQVTDAIVIDWYGFFAQHLSMAEVDGKPGLCYQTEDAHLVYAIRLGR